MSSSLHSIILLLLLFNFFNNNKVEALDKITVEGQQILVNGKPFILNGAAGNIRFDLLKQLGGTVIRTYGDEIEQIIGPASQAGLKIVAGFWMAQVSQNYVDYKRQDQVDAQNENLKKFVLKYKDNPAVLCWGIGNEIEYGAASSADTIPVWKAIDKAAKLVRSLDPNRPTMAVFADVGDAKAKEFLQYVTNIQIFGVNSYGSGLPTVVERVRRQGWTGPLVISETGPLGHWQAQVTPWSASIELSSDQKAKELDKYMTMLKSKVQGIIIFYWGTKIEATPTWHSFLYPFSNNEYERTSEVLAKQWGGKLNNRAPRINNFNFQDGKYGISKWNKGDTVKASLSITDPDRDSIKVVWTVLAERTDSVVGANFTSILTFGSSTGVTLNTNTLNSGAYRLYMAALDNKGAVATANLPFYIN